ncbi:hypothetical protein KY284_007803 [Solanum tuberosum]|nr:hypothetical protein KY284_007803 [Solanum tuberosum]
MEDQKVLKVFVDDSIKEMKDSISKDLAEFRSMLLEAFGENAIYFDKCSWVTKNFGDHLDYLCMEYECGISAIEPHKVSTMTRDTIETHFPTDLEHHVTPCDVANDYAVVENNDKNEGETSLIIPIEDNMIFEFYPFLFSQPCWPLMPEDFGGLTLPDDFGDLTLCVRVKNSLTPFYWFDTGQHTSQPKHSLGIGCSQFATQNVGEPHPRVLAIKVTTYCYLLPQQPEMDLYVWDPGISSKFWVVTSSIDSLEVLIVFESIENKWSCLCAKLSDWKQLNRVEIGVETFNAMYFDKCKWVTENIGDHLDYLCMEYECGISAIELHSYDSKNKWMALSSPYFVCNILMKALYSLLPNDNFEWSMTQPDSYSLPGFIVSLTFANRPFDASIHDIPLSYGANENMFRNTSFVSTYILVVWGEQVCCLRRKHLGTVAFE